jgi:ATP-dependent exoDNAse (exonuclease V) beta subunit
MDNLPIDQESRNRFSLDLEKNFSLVCPAGSGKTHSISHRVLSIAQRPDALELLPRLVVVTFTNASAEEMHARSRETLIQARVPWDVQRAFDFAFFGTIHSFANRLLRNYGHFIGIPPVFEVCKDADPIWGRFVRRITPAVLSDSHTVLRHYPLQSILGLVKEWDCMHHPDGVEVEDSPVYDFSEVYGFELPKRKDTAKNIEDYQRKLKAFEDVLHGRSEVDYFQLPVPDKGGKAFLEVANSAIAPVQAWINQQICNVAYKLATEFRKFRVKEGLLLFDDIIFLARELMLHERGKGEVRADNHIILLDEAQDTDPYQFDFLIESVRPVDATGLWRDKPGSGIPEPGRFSMVGDLQQSIHSKRADLTVYRQAIEYIGSAYSGAHLNYEVTFRCDRQVVSTAESIFSGLLDGDNGQVPYVPITARTDASQGNVFRLPISPLEDAPSQEAVCEHEGETIAEVLIQMRQAGQITRWNDVALICPRKDWFRPLTKALRRAGITSQFLSYGTQHKDSLAWSWATAFARSFTCPSDAYETVGLLRDVYGFSDVELFDYAEKQGDRFILNGKRKGESPVVEVMNRLSALRKACTRSALLDAVEVILEEIRPRLDGNREELQMLERISCLAAKFEKSGSDLEAFAEMMRKELTSPMETSGENPNDSVQIITDLKAKGLQWEVVILPYLFRTLYSPNSSYPKLIGSRLDPARVVSRKEDVLKSEKERLDTSAMQELERRLYVSFTRPKHTLILCDDESAMAPFSKSYLPNYGKVLRANEGGQLNPVWKAIPEFDHTVIAPLGGVEAFTSPSPTVVTVDLDEARSKARPELERIRPYRSATSFHTEEREYLLDDNTTINDSKGRPSSITYGVWWHNTMKVAPWGDRETCKEFFSESLEKCPDKERGKRELKQLLGSQLAELIFSGDFHIKTEIPFQYRNEDGHSIEGVMDMALIDVFGGRWFVVDWKTNQNVSLDVLERQYEGQIEAYEKAVLHLVEGSKVSGGVYSTALGTHSFISELVSVE